MPKSKFFFVLFFSLFLASCGEHSSGDTTECTDMECLLLESGLLSRTGWLASRENLNDIPQDISVSEVSALPPSVSLEDKFPPIGDQGQYGTCVTWAAGYNLKTALNGIEKGWSSTDLAEAVNQTSPKDLWLAINNSDKNSNCNGTSFEAALDALVLKGAASLSSVPYNMGNCYGSSDGNANNKLANYRTIAYNNTIVGSSGGSKGMTPDNFKGYLAQGRPVVFGAKLGDRFIRWSNASPIGSDTYNDPGMEHANHAMVLVGYDDGKNAFRVRNSWGTNWGDNGSIWVDYDFFLNSFVFAAFVAQNSSSPVQEEIKEGQLLAGYDLLAALGDDFENPNTKNSRARAFSYEVYNAGKETILASQRWAVLYMYYNAHNANDFGIIYEDYYTDEFGKLGGCYIENNKILGDCFGKYTKTSAVAGATWNNINVAPGKKAGEAEFGPGGFYISYEMPRITGKYYLVVYADAYDKIKESNEDNNFYFIGAEGGKPLEFTGGVMQNKPAAVTAKVLAKQIGGIPRAMAKSVREIGGSANAYTPGEIKTLVLQSKKSGVLAKKVEEYRESGEKPVKERRIEN